MAVLGGLSLAVMFAVESGTWFFRAQATPADLGIMLARANQLLYSSRLFAFGFQLVISLMIDMHAGWGPIWLTFAVGFATAVVVHVLAFHVPRSAGGVWRLVLYLAPQSAAERGGFRLVTRSHVVNHALFRRTLLATVLLAAAATVPFVLATLFEQLRMTMGSVAQVLNFAGSISMITLVESALYRSIDEAALGHAVFDYLLGRVWGFACCLFVIVGVGIAA